MWNQPIRNSFLLMRARLVMFSIIIPCSPAMARDGELIQTQYFFHQADTICRPNSSYVTTKLYETSACGCNNNTIFQSEPFPRTVDVCSLATQKSWWCCESRKMATPMNASFFVFNISLPRNYWLHFSFKSRTLASNEKENFVHITMGPCIYSSGEMRCVPP